VSQELPGWSGLPNNFGEWQKGDFDADHPISPRFPG
jgi:hypothetical protein